MKKILNLGLMLLSAPLAKAWSYSDGDVLLIFRESAFNDVEFNIGNVSQFTSLAAGTTIAVSNWDLNLVTNTFGADLTGVSVVLTATTPKTALNRVSWLTGNDTAAAVSDLTPSAWQFRLWSTINGIGTKPVLNQLPASSTNAYLIDPEGVTGTASYDYVVTGGFANLSAIALFGGNVDFTVEGVAPASFAFWAISANVARPPAQYVGTFAIDAIGNLTFTAGPVVAATPPSITGITRSGAVSTVSFSTISGGNYSLVYTTQLGEPVSAWPVVGGPVAGDGNNHSLNHTTSDSGGFYSVVRTP